MANQGIFTGPQTNDKQLAHAGRYKGFFTALHPQGMAGKLKSPGGW